MYLRHSIDGPDGKNINFSVPEVRDFRDGVPSVGGIAEYSSWGLTLERNEEAVRIDVGLITGNYFEVMGLSPVLGRVTRPSDDGAGAAPVMVLTHDGWLKRFGGDSSIVGKRVIMDKTAVTVIGVVASVVAMQIYLRRRARLAADQGARSQRGLDLRRDTAASSGPSGP